MADQMAEVLRQEDGPTINAEAEVIAEPEQVGEAEPQATPEQDDTPEHRKRLGGWQRKIAKQEQEIAFWRDEALKGRTAEPTKPTATVSTEAEPKPDAFATYEEYVRAVSRWEAKQTFSALREQEAKDAEAEAVKAEQQEVKSHWQQEYARGRSVYDDFDEVLSNPATVLTPAMSHVILNSEHGAEMAYYLGKHPEEAQAIAALADYDPMGLRMAAEMGKIEARVAPKETAVRTTASRAPRPPTPVSKTSSTETSVYDDKISGEEWLRRRNAQLRGK